MLVEVNIHLTKNIDVPLDIDQNTSIEEQFSYYEVEEAARELIKIPEGWEETDFYVDYE